MTEHTIEIRVRYPEVDGMGYLHHSRYLQYFEMGRVELLRALGHSYADLERDGVFFVVAKADIKYKAPARYDDLLTLTTRVKKQTHVRIDHTYELRRGQTLLAEASTTIACVGRDGQLRQIPESLDPTADPTPEPPAAAVTEPVTEPTATPPVEPEPTGDGPIVVDIDWPCVNCGYNLRALGVDGKCPECGEPIAASVADDEYLVNLAREIAGKTLGEVRRWLKSPNHYARSAAAYSLAMREGSDEALGDLIHATADHHADVRWWAVSTLVAMRVETEDVLRAFKRATGDSDADVREVAMKGLRR